MSKTTEDSKVTFFLFCERTSYFSVENEAISEDALLPYRFLGKFYSNPHTAGKRWRGLGGSTHGGEHEKRRIGAHADAPAQHPLVGAVDSADADDAVQFARHFPPLQGEERLR